MDEVGRNLTALLHLVGTCLVLYALVVVGLGLGRGNVFGSLIKAATTGGAGLLILKLVG